VENFDWCLFDEQKPLRESIGNQKTKKQLQIEKRLRI
jgi:hypothetical protein